MKKKKKHFHAPVYIGIIASELNTMPNPSVAVNIRKVDTRRDVSMRCREILPFAPVGCAYQSKNQNVRKGAPREANMK